MKWKLPDTNVLIYGFVAAGKSQERAEAACVKFLDRVEKNTEKMISITVVDNEFFTVFDLAMTPAMKLAIEAKKCGDLDEAKEKIEIDDNFYRAVNDLLKGDNPVKELNEWRRNVRNAYSNFKDNAAVRSAGAGDIMPKKTEDCILSNIFRKGDEKDSNLSNDVYIIFRAFQEAEGVRILSCDKNMYKTDFDKLASCFELDDGNLGSEVRKPTRHLEEQGFQYDSSEKKFVRI